MTTLAAPVRELPTTKPVLPPEKTTPGLLHPTLTRSVEGRVTYVADRPITFEEFLDLWSKDDNVELIDGVGVEKTVVQLDHERLFIWLARATGTWVEEQGLGEVLGSRSAVRINAFHGRLPDLLFVSRERVGIMQQRNLTEAPDLVIELVSPGDRPSDLIALETDYRLIGVRELVFIDRPRQTVRILRQTEADTYAEESLTAGETLVFATLSGLTLQTDWLFTEPRPVVRTILNAQTPPQATE